MTVFVTTTFPAARQGLTGGVINSVLLQLGLALLSGADGYCSVGDGGGGGVGEELQECVLV